MNPGTLNRRGTLQEPVRVRDEEKGWDTRYVPVATVWAEFRKVSAAAAANFVESLHVEIAIRIRKDVTKGWQFVCAGKTYAVQAVYEENRELTILICQEVLASGNA